MSCSNVGSGLQALGAAIELWALLVVVWRPWLRPKVVNARSAVARTVRGMWPGSRGKHVELQLGDSAATSDAALDISTTKRGPDDEPKATLEDRVKRLVERVGNIEARLAKTEERLPREFSEKLNAAVNEIKAAQQLLENRLERLEAETIQVRVKDALRFLAGVVLSLIGAVVGTLC